MTPGSDSRPVWIVVEDGHEYVERFERFLGEAFRFVRASNLQEALRAAPAAAGLIVDLDFSRTAPAELCDEAGAVGVAREPAEQHRLAEAQGILILRALRARGTNLPALLFADIDDGEQCAFLERSLAPVALVRSSEGLPAIAARLRAPLTP